MLAASVAVTDAVVAYKKQRPETVFQLSQRAAETDCDVTVADSSEQLSALPEFERRETMEETIYLAVPKNSAYADYKEITLEEVKNEGFVHLAGSRCFHTVCDGFFIRAGFKPRISFESDSLAAVKNVISASAGVGFWPEYSWGEASADVKLLPISKPVCRRELVIGLHKNSVPSTVASDFYEHLLAFLKSRRETARKSEKDGTGTR